MCYTVPMADVALLCPYIYRLYGLTAEEIAVVEEK